MLFRLEHAGEVRDSDVSAWHKTQSSQFVVAAADFSDDDAALMCTSLTFLDMSKDTVESVNKVWTCAFLYGCAGFSLQISQLCRFGPAQLHYYNIVVIYYNSVVNDNYKNSHNFRIENVIQVSYCSL